MELESTQTFFKHDTGIENVVLPFLGYCVKKLFLMLGLNYTETVFNILSVLPYFAFMVMFCCILRKSLGLVGTITGCLALHTSGMTPNIYTGMGNADGISYVILLLAFFFINNYWATLLLIVVGSLNHYLSVGGILLVAVSRFIMRPRRKYAAIILSCLLVLVVVQLVWSHVFGHAAWARADILVRKAMSPGQQIREVYYPFPWNFLSSFRLVVLPLLYLAVRLVKTRVTLALGYIIPILSGALLIYILVDVTRILAFLFMISFFYMMVAMSADRSSLLSDVPFRIDFLSRRRLFRVFIVCSLLNVLGPSYFVFSGITRVP